MASYTTVADWQDVEAGYVVDVTIRQRRTSSTRADGTTVSTSGKSAATRSSGISEIRDFRGVVETAKPFRDDNAHERTKGHERHAGDDVEHIDFPGMLALYDRFKREVSERSSVSWNWPE